MGIREIAGFVLLQQISQALVAYLKAIKAGATNPYAAAGVKVGIQFFGNLGTAAGAGVIAAQAEFQTTQTAESTAMSVLTGLPPIS
jgi:hypothetical protein